MQCEKTKVRPAARALTTACRPAAHGGWRAGYGLLLLLVLLGSSCARRLNQRTGGRHYAVRRQPAERRPAYGASRAPVSKSKAKATTPAPAGGSATTTKTVTKHVIRMGNATGTLASVIEAARSYQGVPYLYGGTTRLGLDCSGLLQLSFAEAGVTIPRSSNEQAGWGDPVKPTDLQPGDLLFFGPAPGAGTITHVGLVTVVDAEGVEFIHASTSLGVIENSFESDYYLSRFIRAVRPRF